MTRARCRLTAEVEPVDPWARWESPRAIALVVGATAVLIGVPAGLAGYKLGSTPTPQIVFQPGAIQVALEPTR